MTDFSKVKLLEFLDFLKKKGLMNGATVSARKAATNTFLSILTDEEAADLRKIDLDEVALRFSNLKGSELRPESIKVYKSRVGSALEDLKNYKANPLSFKPSITTPKPSSGVKESAKPIAPKLDTEIGAEVTFPIPIRPGVVVKIVGMPSDLTKKEASKIANVVLALATESEAKT